MLIDKKVIKAEKHSVQTYGGKGINTSCNAPSYSKRSFFIGLTGGRGAVIATFIPLLNLVLGLYLLFARGTYGPNEYGPDPIEGCD